MPTGRCASARGYGGAQGEHGSGCPQAIRGVALGVVVTAIAQTMVGGIGLAIAGILFAAVLTLIMFLTAVAQVGAALVIAAPVFWLYWSAPAWAPSCWW